MTEQRSVLFHRDFRSFTGGHLKVWHYFTHVRSSPDHDAWVRMSPDSVWDDTNPWRNCAERVLPPGSPFDPDVLFLAGLDWLSIAPELRSRPPQPIVNLVQHVRHARPDDPRFEFLRHPAVRICVSPEVEDAIVATGLVNGPVFTVANAVGDDVLTPDDPPRRRDVDLLVVANKQPHLGRVVAARLGRRARTVRLVSSLVPRTDLVAALRRARVTLFLPHRREGFYLPALEGMALGTAVVCPDCVGNRSFCLPGVNCLRPAYSEDAVVAAVESMFGLPKPALEAMLEQAAATASTHTLAAERAAFLDVLGEVVR